MASNTTKSLFAKFKEKFAQANANIGEGSLGPWPDHGDHECILLSVSVEPGSFNVTQGNKINAGVVQFHYQTVPNPENPDSGEALVWKGAPFILPTDPDSIPASEEGKQRRVEMELERLKGHIKSILGDSMIEDDVDYNLEAIQEKISSGNPIVLEVFCEHRKPGMSKDGKPPRNPNAVYKTEYIKKLLSS